MLATSPRPILDVFPYEILEKIIFNIPTHEKRNLQNCALASKVFIFPAQQSIFFNVRLGWKASNAPYLIDVFKHSPHLGTFVRELDLAAHPKSAQDAEHAATLFRFMPSVRSLIITKLDYETPWDIMRSSLEDVILPQLRYLRMWCVYDAPVWLLSGCRQLDELHLNDCPSVLDGLPALKVQEIDLLPLRYLRIAHLSHAAVDFLCSTVTQLVALDLPIRGGRFNAGNRSDMPLTRLFKFMNPMANSLVYLDIDAWPVLHLKDRKITDHPFFIGRYPHLRYFYIHLSIGPVLVHDEDLKTQLAWLSSMLREEPSSYPHPLTYIGIQLDKWWTFKPTEQPMEMIWDRLDLALGGDQPVIYPQLKELQFSPKPRIKHATDNMEKLLPLVRERGVLIVDQKRHSWSLVDQPHSNTTDCMAAVH
ncbi:hypothetical protein DL96DRAFT_1611006 [Flagelloscypha sp. PMI_526]|nr:hypothetical protein DL96DRAFT_1611006 [Flagelloscypha sp. PMI_526]